MTKTASRTIADFAQIPLAVGSFLFFRVTRFVLRGFVVLANRSRRGKTSSWRVVSADFIAKPLALPILMTKAPRWNTHAVVAMAGPVFVKSSIAIHARQANESAEVWGLAIQPMGHGRKERVSSDNGGVDVSWQTLPLPAGEYTLVMRYYGTNKQASLPAIRIDDRDQIAAMPVTVDNNKFYESLAHRSSWLYVCLGYYVYTMLRFADWLPKSFITGEFLPAGDAGMKYSFGAVRRGIALRISVPPEVLSNYAIYFTGYNRASFPVVSQQIDSPEYVMAGTEEDGFYLIRLVLRKGRAGSQADDLLSVRHTSESDLRRVPT